MAPFLACGRCCCPSLMPEICQGTRIWSACPRQLQQRKSGCGDTCPPMFLSACGGAINAYPTLMPSPARARIMPSMCKRVLYNEHTSEFCLVPSLLGLILRCSPLPMSRLTLCVPRRSSELLLDTAAHCVVSFSLSSRAAKRKRRKRLESYRGCTRSFAPTSSSY